jgi:hypothetical protein
MSFTEAAAIGAMLVCLALGVRLPVSEGPFLDSFVLAFFLVLLVLALNPRRWQLAPAALALPVLFLQQRTHQAPDFVALGAGLVLVCLFAGLASGFPTGRPRGPDGPFKAGVAEIELTRPGRSAEAARRLSIKAWYPAAPARPRLSGEPLWSDALSLQDLPAPVRALLGYLKGVNCHSLPGASLAPGAPHPLLVYNHSLLSFASENTLLMEELASRGYVVLSIRHQGQAAEYKAVQAGLSEDERARDKTLVSKLKRAASRQERAELSLQLYRNSTGLSGIVRRRAEDTVHVVDRVDQLLANLPGGSGAPIVSKASYGALGLSLGGAVATRLCQIDPRCRAAANLDGGLYGADDGPGQRPYLMIYSEANAGSNDASKRAGLWREQVLERARHLDLHDAAIILPALKWLGMLGPGSGEARSLRVRKMVAAFFDEVLKPV